MKLANVRVWCLVALATVFIQVHFVATEVYEQEIDQLPLEFEADEQEIDKLPLEFETNEQEIDKLPLEFEADEQEIDELLLEFEADEQEIDDLPLEFEADKQEIDELPLEFEADEQEIDNLPEVYKQEIDKLTQEFEVYEQQIDKLSLVTRYAGMGYNILFANPEGDFKTAKSDPGIKTTRFIFKHTFDEGRKAFYRGTAMNVPDEVVFHMTDSCSKSESTNAYSGQTSYKRELSHSLEVSGSYSGLVEAEFSLSHAMRQEKEVTQNQRKVVVQKTTICNFGEARYKLANAKNGVKGYSLTKDFMNAVRQLSPSYSTNQYMRFLDDWGTHILETVSVGTRYMSRSSATYLQVYEFLSKQQSGSASGGISYGGVSGSVSLSIEALDRSVNKNTRIGTSLTEFTIGTREVPLPIHTKVVPIIEALTDKMWPPKERAVIQKKRANLDKALRDYARNKNARIAGDPNMAITLTWPQGRYSMIQPTSGCPSGWSSGWRHQDNEDSRNANRWSPSNINSYIHIGLGRNIRTYYCTKTSSGGIFSWPRGRYCIARYGGSCPSGFYGGYMHWDDEDSRNANRLQRPIPDGSYDRNTRTQFCCRSDGNHHNPMLLPPTRPFVLYRYNGRCQSVRGMNVRQLFIHFDDEDSRNANKCSGNRPDGPCGRNHEYYLCYYTRR